MEIKNLIVKKDFGNLRKGDEIQITTDSDSRIYFNAINRTSLERFYGNEKGQWGISNRYTRDQPEFFLKSYPLYDECVIIFDGIPSRPKHPTINLVYADNTENWFVNYLHKIIQDYMDIGVF
jgi:hypothetical protein